jgi:hypothetical protein
MPTCFDRNPSGLDSLRNTSEPMFDVMITMASLR